MKETSDPAAVRFGPFQFEPITGRLLRPWLGCFAAGPASVEVVRVGDGSRPVAVLGSAPPAHERDAQPSPGGRYLAWISDARGDTEVVVRDVRSGETLGTWPAGEAGWAPDGSRLLVGVHRRWQALAVTADAATRLPSASLPTGIRVPGESAATSDLEVVLQWARDVRRQAPVTPRPLTVGR